MKQEINIPKLGSEMKTGQILEWHVKVGDHVEEDQELCEIKTEKMNAQVESLYDGVTTRDYRPGGRDLRRRRCDRLH